MKIYNLILLMVDIDGDGMPNENIKEITEWKPEHNVNEPFAYDTMKFEEPKEPNDQEPQNPDEEKPDTEIKGNYYPGDNMGGALTADTTNRMIYISMGCVSLGMICLILFKYRQKKPN